ncbi:hypothetical protein GQ55_2G317900 [Panicum hallii var. hallii]|uniref:Uncharacterized protein n=1 Tax=Panicum hallii var. hallii TaxID=1504633 RepID=A0A2T7EUJ4_9POAL|nr:hypothetical protein GQ55_2G317900 [Panicum hallii var. hallii]
MVEVASIFRVKWSPTRCCLGRPMSIGYCDRLAASHSWDAARSNTLFVDSW